MSQSSNEADVCIVYVLENAAMEGLVKIGVTKADRPIEERIKELSQPTGVPVAFSCFYAAKVKKSMNVEKRIHRAFDRFRFNRKREFFEIEPEAAADIIAMVALEDVTPDKESLSDESDRQTEQRVNTRRENFNFKMVDIEPGATLEFDRDDSIKCMVVDSRMVEFEGERMSLSAAALVALKKKDYQWKSAHGPAHWTYNGRTLRSLRREAEGRGD